MNTNTHFAIIALICSGLFSANCSAVYIDISGKVVASPCVVNGGSDSLEVNLGESIQADKLSVAGSATDWKNFDLTLGSCPASTSTFSVVFSGVSDDESNYYKNTGSATNLKIELTSQSGDKTLSNGATLENLVIPATHSYNIPLRVRAVSKGGVMPGSIKGQVQATFTWQ